VDQPHARRHDAYVADESPLSGHPAERAGTGHRHRHGTESGPQERRMFQMESCRVKTWIFPLFMENDDYRTAIAIQQTKPNPDMRNLLNRTILDEWVKAGGPLKAYVESVPVEVTDGKLLITFTNNIENPEINGIEIIPQI
jgi:hypothetical protein